MFKMVPIVVTRILGKAVVACFSVDCYAVHSFKVLLFQIGFHHIDHFTRGGPFRLRLPVRVSNVKTKMAFENLGHEAVKGASGRRDKLEYLPTIPFFLERFFQGTDLPSNPAHPEDELLLVPDSMSHQKIKYTPGGYLQSTTE